VGGYEFNDHLTQEDSDGGSNTTLHTDWGNSAWQAYGEAKIASDYAGSVQWQAAASYLYEDLDVANVFSFQAVIPVIANQSFDQTTSSWAVYGHAVWDVLEDFSIEAGARYSWERKVFAIESQTGMLAGRTLIEDEAKDSWSALTGSLALSWRPIEDVNVYVKYSRGVKPGHFNGGAVLERQAIDPTRPERLDSYEVGLKSFWFDQALTVNASAFYYDYEDYQVFRIESTGDGRIPVQQLINANDARIYGLEFELETRPFQNFESADFFEGVAIQARIGWLESEYLDFTDTFFARRGRPPNVEITEVPVVFTGNRLVSSPRFSASAQIEWDRSLGAGGRYGSIVPSYNFTFRDDTFYDPSEGRGTDPTLNFPKYAVGQEAFFLHNFRIAWRNEDHTIEVAGWVRNAFDKEYKADAFDLSAGFNNVLEVYGDPRTYGVTLSLSY
jgi:iron complex outermembrane receptor protein